MADFDLSPQQAKVVNHRGGTLLVSAAAGSGKTRVLVERLMGFVCDAEHPVNIDDFLIITYTRAAAAELRGRIAGELSRRLAAHPEDRRLRRQLIRVHSAQISTVHAFCTELLRENAHLIDQTADFRVLEQTETDQLREQVAELCLDEAYAGLEEDPGRQELFDSLGAGRDDRALHNLLLRLYEQVICHRDPDAWMEESVARYEALADCRDATQTIWGAFLLARLQAVLEEADAELERACQSMLGAPILEKNYLPVFRQNQAYLRRFRQEQSWDGLAAAGGIEKGKLGSSRGFEDKAFLERLKTIRQQALGKAEDALAPFSAPSQQVLEELRRSGAAIEALFQLVKDFRTRYQAEKARIRAMDFSDLEQYSLKLLYTRSGAPSELAKTIQARYAEIMVDEYQDSNQVQEAIFAAVEKPEGNRFLVGDVKQSIYRFRLADPTIFLEKYRDYPISQADSQEAQAKILLSTNYRSRPEILEAVNDVFRGVMSEQMGELAYGDDEALIPGREVLPTEQPCVELHAIDTSAGEDEDSPDKLSAEAAFVAQRIQALFSEQIQDGEALRPIRPEDVVILMRSPRNAALAYLQALRHLGIPASYDQTDDLLQTTEVRLLRSLLQVVDNPRQDIPLTAVLLSPLFRFSAAELALLRAKERRGSLYDALSASEEEKPRAFLSLLERFRALRPMLRLDELTEELLETVKLRELLSALPEGEKRAQNLRAFLERLSAAASGGQNLQRFLADLDELEERGGALSVSSGIQTGVRIMSVHASKGLEFPVVVLADLSRRFNGADLTEQVLTHPEWGAAASTVDPRLRLRYPTIAKQALAAVKEREMKSEEQRVLYVAMTRAKERLIMTYCAANLEKKLSVCAQTASYPVPPQTAAEASCLGDWVLRTAISRVEAGALHRGGNRPDSLRVAGSPWSIQYHALVQEAEEIATRVRAAGETWPEDLEQLLSFRYPHAAASRVRAKLTATQLKGRNLDEEVSDGEGLREPISPAMKFPKPDFSPKKRLSPAERGTTMHLFMQYADYGCCLSLEGIEAERQRLVEREFLTREQGEALQTEKLLAFFRSELGQRFLGSETLEREFKFSVLMDASAYYPDCSDEQILLQGVVDCFLNEPDGLTILDFKTDRIQPGQEQSQAERYRGQLTAYSDALSRIFGKPVKRRILWFFATSSAVDVE